ncbi:MAG: PIN domain-containing protein [Euryarchaeota archaeon]|nr:PIN domain-containing protein [Euryarchaeota archaeon]
MISENRRLLVDTSYLVAHFHTKDAHHGSAQGVQDQFMSGRWDELVLIDAVFAETVTVLAARTGYGRAKQVGDLLRNGDEITWVHMGDRMDGVWHRYLAQPDGRLSVVDCAIWTVAEESRIPEIATFDRSFDDVPGLKRVPHEDANASS